MSDLARLAGVERKTMQRRLLTLSVDEAVALGPTSRQAAQAAPAVRYLYRGELSAVEKLAALAGCPESTMQSRLTRGWSPEDAVAAGPRVRIGHLLGSEPVRVAELAAMAGCTVNAMTQRLNGPRARTPEEAVAMGSRSARGRT